MCCVAHSEHSMVLDMLTKFHRLIHVFLPFRSDLKGYIFKEGKDTEPTVPFCT